MNDTLTHVKRTPSISRALSRRFRLCLAEIDQVQRTIGWYDDAVMNGKRWCLATWGALTALGLYGAHPAIVLIGLAVLVGFAATELTLRRYQRRYIVRAGELEELLANGDLRQYRLSIIGMAAHSDRRQELWYALIQPHFSLQYGFFALLSLGLAVYTALK